MTHDKAGLVAGDLESAFTEGSRAVRSGPLGICGPADSTSLDTRKSMVLLGAEAVATPILKQPKETPMLARLNPPLFDDLFRGAFFNDFVLPRGNWKSAA